jgi:hypothetical protein
MKKTLTALLAITILLSPVLLGVADARERKHTPLKNLLERRKESSRGLINRTLTRIENRRNKVNYVEMDTKTTIRLTSKSCANGNCPIQAYDF